MNSILYFLVWAGLLFLMMRFGCGAHLMGHGHRHDRSESDRPGKPSGTTGHWTAPSRDTDPVCHMSVETAKAKTAVYEGHVYHFCSQDCRGKFEEDPGKYVSATRSLPVN